MAYTIWEESRDEDFADGNIVITRTFRVEPYSSRGDFVADLLGAVRFFGGEIVRYPPARDPWFPFCWCVSARVKHIEVLNSPENVASGSAAALQKNYAQAGRVVAVYKSLDRDLAPPGVGPGGPGNSNEKTEKELASEEWDYSNVQFTLPNAFWKWGDDEALIKRDTPVAITLPKIDLSLVRHFCLTKPHQAILTLGGRVNKSAFGIWPPETLRFDGLHAGRKIMSRGIPYWDLTYKFAAFPHYDWVGTVRPKDRARDRRRRPAHPRHQALITRSRLSSRISSAGIESIGRPSASGCIRRRRASSSALTREGLTDLTRTFRTRRSGTARSRDFGSFSIPRRNDRRRRAKLGLPRFGFTVFRGELGRGGGSVCL
jgi:hypothetical protein